APPGGGPGRSGSVVLRSPAAAAACADVGCSGGPDGQRSPGGPKQGPPTSQEILAAPSRNCRSSLPPGFGPRPPRPAGDGSRLKHAPGNADFSAQAHAQWKGR